MKASRVPPESGSRKIGRKALSTTAAPGTTKPPSTKKPATKKSSDRSKDVKENHSPVREAVSPLAASILNRMGQGLKTPHGIEPDFDLVQLNKVLNIVSKIDANAAEDDSLTDLRALFRIGTNGEVPPYDAIETLVVGLNQMANVDEEPDLESIERAYKDLFIDAEGFENGTPGQLLVKSIGDVVNKSTKITFNLEPYRPQLEALNTFLMALQRLEAEV